MLAQAVDCGLPTFGAATKDNVATVAGYESAHEAVISAAILGRRFNVLAVVVAAGQRIVVITAPAPLSARIPGVPVRAQHRLGLPRRLRVFIAARRFLRS